MRTIHSLVALLASAGTATADYGLHIPQVEAAVQQMLSRFGCYVGYSGPSGNEAAQAKGWRPRQAPSTVANTGEYWLEQINHQGVAAFNPNASYQVFRNVKDFGAQGDGVTDDTAAINEAISSGDRCAPGACQSSTTTPAVVYFPAGTYLISSSIIDYYFTQLIGNPNDVPTIVAAANFGGSGFGMIDGDEYQAGGVLGYGSTNVFYRQIRNFVLDLSNIPATSAATGVHWPTAQATSLQNVVFKMSDAPGTQHQGLLIESGECSAVVNGAADALERSGGFMNDLVFYGGIAGAVFGNQQFTMRNLSFYNSVTAINQQWDWGWTYKSININNCSIGLNMSNVGPTGQTVGSVTFIDSYISNTPVGILTAHNATSQPPTAGSLILENVQITNVPVAVQGPNGPALAGTTGTATISAWGQGHSYTPNGPVNFEGPIPPFNRSGSLLQGGKFYERSKPQYGDVPVSQFLSTRSAGAKGDGVSDDTSALQSTILAAAAQGNIVFFDAGTYKVTSTLYVPPGSKLVGESYSVIMSSGPVFADMTEPQPVVQVGKSGESGVVEWSDMVVATQSNSTDGQAGAILIEWNLASSCGSPSGMWDVHARIGGFTGSGLQVGQCPKTPTVPTPPTPVNSQCIAAYLTMHVTQSATGLYLENVWLWTADHDLDDPNSTQITVYTGRGLLIESTDGNLWLVGTAVEHHALYQYQLSNTQSVFMGQIQTETPYYQPNPNATIPFPPVTNLSDPDFAASCQGQTGNCADAWGLRVLDSQSILVYGAGLYSFFNNYSTTCSDYGNGETCQQRIFDIEGMDVNDVDVYNLNTVGTTNMITREGASLASFADNINVYPDNIALFRSN